MTGCMCMECQYKDMVIGNKGDFIAVCVCRESDNFLKELELAYDNCELGIIDDIGRDDEE